MNKEMAQGWWNGEDWEQDPSTMTDGQYEDLYEEYLYTKSELLSVEEKLLNTEDPQEYEVLRMQRDDLERNLRSMVGKAEDAGREL